MDEKRKGELAYILLKRKVAEDVHLRDIANFRRNLGNVTKDTGVPTDELLEFAELIVREVFEEQIMLLKKSQKQEHSHDFA